MTNPYAAPAESADGGALPSKPLRILIFQGLLAFQVAAAVALTATALLSPDVQALPLSDIVASLIRPIVGIPLVLALLLALQRLGPKPGLMAPTLAALWWLLSISAHYALSKASEPADLKALQLADAPTLPSWTTGLVLHVFFAWFVVSTCLHRATRAYLTTIRPNRDEKASHLSSRL